MLRPQSLLLVILFLTPAVWGAPQWTVSKDGGITWQIKPEHLPHGDHLEQSGKSVDAITNWDLDAQGHLKLTRSVRWPMLRTLPDNTHAALQIGLGSDTEPTAKIDGQDAPAAVMDRVSIDGILTFHGKQGPLEFQRTLFASNEQPAMIETYEWTNRSDKPVTLTQPKWLQQSATDASKGKWGVYQVRREWIGAGTMVLAPGETSRGGLCISAVKDGEPFPWPDVFAERTARENFRQQLAGTLVLKTPDPIFDEMFRQAKYRTTESIYATRGGLMHGPGGRNKFLAAIWCNDQCEYANPFFAFVDNASARESARNSFAWYAKFINPQYKPIPSSIISEGRDIWAGAGDRGDAAMTAYGASRWALAGGDPELANEVWPLIEWCLEYTHRQLNDQGVPKSDKDELEGRFPAGTANLCTAALYHDALLSSAALARDLGKPAETTATYIKQAAELKEAINRYFGAEVEGYDTYRYYDGNDILRSWICVPLVCGILERKDGTLKALFSDRLWTKDGLLTQAGTKTYWDRSTLYGLRGAFIAGDTTRGLDYLTRFTRQRLLGDHVPYSIEAWPEAGQSHLAAESALYCRIFTEGVLGVRPTGLARCSITPQLPAEWPQASLEKIRSFGRVWNLAVRHNGPEVEVVVTDAAGRKIYQGRKPQGQAHEIAF
ncbi:hypothetical protein KBB96_00015 [Luteolibacter ambystomatis]|uniref:Alpha-L-rhamnosidase six-hairpin glycosidase domain-containing protein n=1 Tax=Luteolibacter ambystomatis TaxID=2824561 RepID=A0A975IZB6_9BACT|nr:hypothetical protein [Luteolibacter ambystomatis]QUE51301.1 hypothetical protein KBB96_00015 [Luteolibacter ambystomatis]